MIPQDLEKSYSTDREVMLAVEGITLANTNSDTLILGTNSADSITNSGDRVTINADNGNNTIQSSGTATKITTGSGNDSIRNEGISSDNQANYSTIDAGDGNNTIYNNNSTNNSILSGNGNDSIYNRSNHSTINSGDGSDTVSNISYYATIFSGKGNDSIFNYGFYSTINGGADNDTISMYTAGHDNIIEYQAGDGYDTIYNLNATDTLKFSNVSLTLQTSGNNIIIDLENGSEKLVGAASLEKLNIVIDNTVSNKFLSSTNYDDTITNSGNSITISSGEGNDSITNTGNNVTIASGGGSDTIYNTGQNASIDSGDGDDSISSYGVAFLTINSGKGNDTISLDVNSYQNVIVYNSEGGNDTIIGYNPSDTINLIGTTVTSTVASDNDLILYTSTGSLTFKDIQSVNVNGTIYGDYSTIGSSSDDSLTNYNSKVTISGYDGNDSITNGGSNVLIDTGDGNNKVSNYGTLVTVKTGNGNNTIYNGGYASNIMGDSGNDSVQNRGESVTIYGGEGTNSVYNLGANSSIVGGSGDDKVTNTGASTTINVGDGNNYVYNSGKDVSIIGGANKERVVSYGTNSTINTGAGNDSIMSYIGSVTTSAGDGDDTITAYGANSSIDGGNDNDKITNYAGGVGNTLNSGKGSDTIDNKAANVVIIHELGDGNDLIKGFKDTSTLRIAGDYTTQISGSDVLVTVDEEIITLKSAATLSTINIEDLDVTINNTFPNTLISSKSGNDKIINNGKYVTIKAGDGNDSINNYSGSHSSIDGGNGDDDIYSEGGSNVIIDGGNGADAIALWGSGDHNSVNGGSGDDKISTCGMEAIGENHDIVCLTPDNSTLDGGDGNDYIYNDSNGSTLLGGAGNDSICNDGDTVKIDGGADDDSILSCGDNVTINGGDGNDTISSGSNSSIDGGNGKDFISNSISEIYGYEGNTVYSSDNVTINGGDDDDTISNGNDGYKNFKIVGGKNLLLNGGAGNDSISNQWSSFITIDGGSGDDSIYNNGSNVTIDGGLGDDSIINDGDDVTINTAQGNDTIKLGEAVSSLTVEGFGTGDVIELSAAATLETINGGIKASNISIGGLSLASVNNEWVSSNDGFVYQVVKIAGVKVNDKIITFNATSGKETLFTLTGVETTDGIIVDTANKKVTLTVANLNKQNVTIDSDYTLALDKDYSPSETVVADFDGSAYKTAQFSDGYTVSGNTIIYTPSSGGATLFTLTNAMITDAIKVDTTAKKVTLTAANLNKKNVTVDGGYTLMLDKDYASKQTKAAGFDGFAYKTEQISDGYTASGNTIIYTPSSGGATLFTLTNATITDAITVDTTAKKVTLTASNLNGKSITVDGEYTLALDKNYEPSEKVADGFVGNVYKTAQFSDGYTAAGNTINYVAASGGETLFTLTNVATTEGITVDTANKKVTLTEANLNKANVTVDGGYTLALDKDYASKQTKAAGFDGSSYKTATISDGYTASGNTINYVAASGGETLFTLTNVATTEGITVDTANKKVTLTEANLNGKTITVDGEYTLALDKNYEPNEKVEAGFDGNAYKTAQISDGYTASGNTITYIPTSGGKTLFTLTNAIITDAIKVDTTAKKVTLTAANLNKKNVTVDGGYTLALDKDYGSKQTKAAGFDGNAYKAATMSDGYTSSGNTITYVAASGGETLFTLTNATITDDITVDAVNKKVTLTAANLNKQNVTVDGDYTLALKDVSAPKQIKAAGFDGTSYKTATISEGYTASGNTITYIPTSGGKTLFTLTNAIITDAIKVDTVNKKVTLTATNLNGKTITVDGGYTLALDKDYAAKQTKSAGFDGNAYKAATMSEGYTASGNTITYIPTSGGETLFTLTNAKITDDITVDTANKKVTLTETNLNGKTITVDGGYTLALDKDYASKQTKAAGFDGNAYKTATISEGYIASGNKIIYTAASGGETLFTLKDATITKDIVVDTTAKKVTLTAANLNKKNVTVDGGYTLALDKDYASKQTKASGFDGSAYKTATMSEGYTASDNTITYIPTSGGKTLFTLTNTTITDAITVDTTAKKVTLTAANLNDKDVTVTGDYKLSLAKDVPTATVKTDGSFTKFANGIATYKTTAYSDYYTLKNNKITHTAASGGKVVTIAGLNSKTKLATIKSGIKVTVQKDGSLKIAFNNANVLTTKAPTVTVDKGISYTLTVADSLKPATLTPDWKVSGTNASLKTDTSAGYTVSKNKIVYSSKKTGSAKMELGGLVKNAKLTAPAKKVVTLDTAILGKNTSLKSNAENYSVKLTGNMSGKKFTGTANADTLNIAANNAAVLGGAGNDKFTVSGAKVTVTGGKGNDTFNLSGKNPVLIYSAGDGNDKVNYVKGLQVSLSGSTEIKTLGKKDSTLVLGFGKNSSISVTGAKTADTLKVASSSGSVTLSADKFDLASKLTFNSKNSSVKVAKNFTGTLTPSDDIYLGGKKLANVATINAGAATGKVTISGNAKANTIIGGLNSDSISGNAGNDSLVGGKGNDKLYGNAGNDTLFGGVGNDTLSGYSGKDKLFGGAGNDSLLGGKGNDSLWGNAGADTFIYGKGDGQDIIYGFANDDMLKITGTFSASYNKSKKEIYFNVDSTAKAITLKDFTTTSFNINSSSYKISGTKLIKK